MKSETIISQQRQCIIFIDKELLPLYGFRNIKDYETTIICNQLKKKLIEQINGILNDILQHFPKKLFNLHKTDGQIQTTKQSFNLLKKCLLYANIPFEEWTKRVDDKNINYMRLQKINIVLYDYINKMQEIQQIIQPVQEANTTIDENVKPTTILNASELYKRSTKTNKTRQIITDLRLTQTGDIIVNDSVEIGYFVKYLSFKFFLKSSLQQKDGSSGMFSSELPSAVRINISDIDDPDYDVINDPYHVPDTNLIPLNSIIPIEMLSIWKTIKIIINPPNEIKKNLNSYYLCMDMVDTPEFCKEYEDYRSGKCCFMIDTPCISYNYCYYINHNTTIAVHKKIQKVSKIDVVPKDAEITLHEKCNGKIKEIKKIINIENMHCSLNRDISNGIYDDIYYDVIKKGTTNICKIKMTISRVDIGGLFSLCATLFDGIYEPYCIQLNECDEIIPNVLIDKGEYFEYKYVMVRNYDTISGIIINLQQENCDDISFAFETAGTIIPLKFDNLENSDLYKKIKHIKDNEYKNSFIITNINLDNQINLVGNIWFNSILRIRIPKKFYMLDKSIQVVKSGIYYMDRTQRKKIANTFNIKKPIDDICKNILAN